MANPPPSRPQKRTSILWALFGFDGRLSREPFWLGFLFMSLLAMLAIAPYREPETGAIVIGPATMVVLIVVFWSELALASKRLHDRGWSAWLVLILLIPLVNLAAYIALGLIPGDKGSNQFGPAPNTRPV